MRYAVTTLWHERKRYFAGVLAVAFSAVLISLLPGVLVGVVSTVSIPVDNSRADIWLAAPEAQACDGGRAIFTVWRNHLAMIPQVVQTDVLCMGYAFWKHPAVGNVLCIVVGCNLEENGLGPIGKLTHEQRIALSEPGTVILDRHDSRRLGITRVGQTGELEFLRKRIRVVGFIDDMPSMAGPFAICSIPTARSLLMYKPNQATYLLGRCKSATDVPAAVESMKRTPDVAVYTQSEFSTVSRMYWITTTKAGASIAFLAVLGLVVGAIVTSQTLYSATMASIKELAVLRALGVPTWRMNLFVVQQAFIVGVVGLCVGLPIAALLVPLAGSFGARVILPWWLLAVTGVITLAMAIASGLFALRSLRQVDPVVLLR